MRLLAVSYHCLFDYGSGAAKSLTELLQLMAQRGCDVETFSGPHLDLPEATLTDVLRAGGLEVATRPYAQGPVRFQVHHLHGGVGRHLVYDPQGHSLMPPSIDEALGFVHLLEQLLRTCRPDIVLTYGGHWTGRVTVSLAKLLGIRVVFWLRNCSYYDPALFTPIDAVMVPCEFARRWYQQKLGLNCIAVPSPVIASKIRCEVTERRYLTMITPQPEKGIYFFAGVIRNLLARRSDIPVLFVEGRAGSAALDQALPNWRSDPRIRLMPATPDPRDFYRLAKVVVVPSLWDETFSRVPVEAFANGIPVICSDRGGLSENCQHAGFVLPIAPAWTPSTRDLPAIEETAPWCTLIERLWDDTAFYQAESARALAAASRLSEVLIADRCLDALNAIVRRPPRPLTGNVQDLYRMLNSRAATTASVMPDPDTLTSLIWPEVDRPAMGDLPMASS